MGGDGRDVGRPRVDPGSAGSTRGATPGAAPRQPADPDGTEVPEELTEGRKEVGTEADSGRHPPHVTVNDEDAEAQDEHPSPDDVPLMPSTASGTDKIPTEEQRQPIDRGSMYDRRPEEDKNQPPSER